MEDEKHCSSFNIWMEYTKHGWVTAGLFRVRQMELGGKTKGVVNGTFQSKWKEWVIISVIFDGPYSLNHRVNWDI